MKQQLTLTLPWPPSVNSTCIDGPGERTRLGYVRIWNGGTRILAHRQAWEKANGAIPPDLELDHLCRNRWCRNVAHLELVTHAENSRRSSKAKLTMEKAIEIRALHKSGMNFTQIGKQFGVTLQCIRNVVMGRSWA